ncbi:aminopeptidase P family protein [Niabella terrae]
MKYLPLDSKLFSTNRQAFTKKMQQQSMAVFVANDEMPQNADALYKYKPNSSLYWLTGIRQEETMLILFPDNPDSKYREVLVLVRPNELKEKWDGRRLRAEEATRISGIETIVWQDSLPALFQAWMHAAQFIYLDSNEHDRKGSWLDTAQTRYIKSLKERYPLHQYLRAAPLIGELRAIKTKYEVAVLQQAIDITENAFRRLLQFIRPGVWEYEVEAEIVHSFLSQRATGEGYNSIIASGDNARVLHYIFNNNQLEEGDLILMDFGAEYGGYNADLTRTVPVNGRFSKRQREVYNSCLRVHRYAASILKPGISIAAYHEKVGDALTKECLKLGLLTKADVKNEDPANRAYRRYTYHGISHHLGVDVHDLGPFHSPLKAGMLLTIEPGIYVEEEKMGIRIENNYWLTRSGNIDLMKNIPIEADEIERLMQA